MIFNDNCPELLLGIKQFNDRDYYGCHDTLEAIWMEAETNDKRFYQGILQIAVACYHLGNSNYAGAAILLGEGRKRLQDYQPSYYGVDIDQLLVDSSNLLKTIQSHSAEELTILIKNDRLNWPQISAT